MKQYKIEGNIDFFSELYKSLDEEDLKLSDNVCLISKVPLTDNFVKLQCGHKFNYLPLYNDIVNHKLKFNTMETSQGQLKKHQIRCPYCRKIQNELLPFYENIPGVKKTHNVNHVDEYKNDEMCKYNNKIGNCSFLYVNPNYNPESIENDTNKKQICCNKHGYLYKTNVASLDEINYYCYTHTNEQSNANKLFFKLKDKNEKNEAKKKLKEEAKKVKDDLRKALKQAKKEAKQKLKESKLQNNNDIDSDNEEIDIIDLTSDSVNEVIKVIDVTDEPVEKNEYCIQIIKCGVNKGNPCGLKSICNSFCKRHYNLSLM